MKFSDTQRKLFLFNIVAVPTITSAPESSTITGMTKEETEDSSATTQKGKILELYI